MRTTMRNPLTFFAAVLALATVGVSHPAHASLIGTDVEIRLLEIDGAVETVIFSDNVAVVDPGLEVDDLLGVFDIDIGSDSIRIDLVDFGTFDVADFLGLVFDSIDIDIIGISGDSNIAGLDDSRVLVDTNAIAFNLQGLTVVEGDFIEVVLELAVEVASPPSIVLMLAGLLVAFRRRAVTPRASQPAA